MNLITKTDEDVLEILKLLTGTVPQNKDIPKYYRQIRKDFEIDLLSLINAPTENMIIAYIASGSSEIFNHVTKKQFKEPNIQTYIANSWYWTTQLPKMRPVTDPARTIMLDKYFEDLKEYVGRQNRWNSGKPMCIPSGSTTRLSALKPTEDQWTELVIMCPALAELIPKRKQSLESELVAKLS
jgi:hypothetical protein